MRQTKSFPHMWDTGQSNQSCHLLQAMICPLFPLLSFMISLKDLSWDKLIRKLSSVEMGLDSSDTMQATVMPPTTPGKTTPATNVTPGTNMTNPQSKLECTMSSSEILSQLHHPNSCPPLVCLCNKPNALE